MRPRADVRVIDLTQSGIGHAVVWYCPDGCCCEDCDPTRASSWPGVRDIEVGFSKEAAEQMAREANGQMEIEEVLGAP